MALFVPNVNVAESTRVTLTGVFRPKGASADVAQIKEVVVTQDPPVVHVFDVVEHGRRFYRRQRFASDASWSLHSPHAGSGVAGSACEQQVWKCGNEWAVRCGTSACVDHPAESLVILRHISKEVGKQTFLPARLLLGLLPDSLLEEYLFWQNEDDSISAELKRDSDATIRTQLSIELVKRKEGASARVSRQLLKRVEGKDEINHDAPVLHLVNLLDEASSDFGRVLARVENVSHILPWCDSVGELQLLQLPRLGLSFRRAHGEMMCDQHAGLALFTGTLPSGADLVAQLGGGSLVLQNPTTLELFVLVSAIAEPLRGDTHVASVTAVGSHVVSARSIKFSDGISTAVPSGLEGVITGPGSTAGTVAVKFDNGAEFDCGALDLAPSQRQQVVEESGEHREQCIVCGRSDRAGQVRKSGFKCHECVGKASKRNRRPGQGDVQATRSPTVSPAPPGAITPDDAAALFGGGELCVDATPQQRAELVDFMLKQLPKQQQSNAVIMQAHRDVYVSLVDDLPASAVLQRLQSFQGPPQKGVSRSLWPSSSRPAAAPARTPPRSPPPAALNDESPEKVGSPGVMAALMGGEKKKGAVKEQPLVSWVTTLPSSQVVFRRGEPVWVSMLASGSRHYLYPVHLSGAFLFTPTVSSALYMSLCQALSHRHTELATSLRMVADITDKEERQLWVRLGLALLQSTYVDAVALRLRLSLQTLPYSDTLSCPWDDAEEIRTYTARRADVRAACALPLLDELELFRNAIKEPDSNMLLNRLLTLRAAAGGVQQTPMQYAEEWSAQPSYDTVTDDSCVSWVKLDWVDRVGAGMKYSRPKERNLTGLNALQLLDGVLGSSGGSSAPPWVLVYEIFTGSTEVTICNGDEGVDTAALLMRLLPDAKKTGSLMSILRVLDYNPRVREAVPVYDEGRREGDSRAKAMVTGLFKITSAATRLVHDVCTKLKEMKDGLQFGPKEPPQPYHPPANIAVPGPADSRWLATPLVGDSRCNSRTHKINEVVHFTTPLNQVAAKTVRQADVACTSASRLANLQQALDGLETEQCVAHVKRRLLQDLQAYEVARRTAKEHIMAHTGPGIRASLRKSLLQTRSADYEAMELARQRAANAVSKNASASWLARVGGVEVSASIIDIARALCSVNGDQVLKKVRGDELPESVWDDVTLWMLHASRIKQCVQCLSDLDALEDQLKHNQQDETSVRLKATALATSLSAQRHYTAPGASNTVAFDPRYLCFEFLFGILLRQGQVALLGKFQDSALNGGSLCHQMIMGQGKTTVIAPLLTLILADGTRLVTACMPRSLLDFSKATFREKFSSPILQRSVLYITFDRFCNVTASLQRKVRSATSMGAILVTAPSSLKAILLKMVELTDQLDVNRLQAKAEDEQEKRVIRRIKNVFGKAKSQTLKEGDVRGIKWQINVVKDVLVQFQKGVLLMDEIDLLLHPLKSELNWPLGEKKALDMSEGGHRWNLPWQLIELFYADKLTMFEDVHEVHTVFEEIRKRLAEGVQQHAIQDIPHVSIINPQFYRNWLVPSVAKYCVVWLRSQGACSDLDKADMVTYMTSPQNFLQPAVSEKVRRSCRDFDLKMLNLARLWVQTLLPHILSRVHRVSYGVLTSDELTKFKARDPLIPKTRRLLAIPFVGKDTPSETSEFQEPDVVIGFTTLSYRMLGLRYDNFVEMLKHMKMEMREEASTPHHQRRHCQMYVSWVKSEEGRVRGFSWDGTYLFGKKDAAEPPRRLSDTFSDDDTLDAPVTADDDDDELRSSVWPLEAVDTSDSDQLQFLFGLLGGSPLAVKYFLTQLVFPEVLDKSPQTLTASAQELAGRPLAATRLGFSGTPNDLLPRSMGRCHYAEGDDGRVLDVLTDPSIISTYVLPDGWSPLSLVQYVANGGYTALIDTGALITGMTNLDVAKALLQNGLPSHFKGVVYMTNDGVRMVLIRNGMHTMQLQQCGLAPSERFTFYDHIHTTGMDIKQPIVCTAAMTVGKDTVFRDAAQGAFRMRGIGLGQSIQLILPTSVHSTMQKTLDAMRLPRSPELDVVVWLVRASLGVEKPQLQLLCQQSLRTVWRHAALTDLQRFREGTVETAECLKVLRDAVNFNISNQILQDAHLSIEETMRMEIAQFSNWLKKENDGDGERVCDAIIDSVRKGPLAGTKLTGMVKYEQEQVQEQEQQQEQEQEQEQELEIEVEQEELVEEAPAGLNYSKKDEDLCRWPVDSLSGTPEKNGVFYPVSEFTVFRGITHSKSPHLQFPPYLLMSDNYYHRVWRLRQVRRLRNVVCMMEWIPDVSQLKLHEHQTPLSEDQMKQLRTAFSLFDSDGSGVIQKKQLRALLESLDMVVEGPEQMDALFSELGALDTPTVSKKALEEAIQRQTFFQIQDGRYFVILCLEEAEHLRAALRSIGQMNVAVRAFCLRSLVSTRMDCTESFTMPPPASQQGDAAEACTMFLDCQDAVTPKDLAWCLRSLHHSPCEDRRLWYTHVRSCRRRAKKPWQELSVSRLFMTADEFSQLAVRATVSRVKMAMVGRNLWPTDLFRMFDTRKRGLLQASELYEGLKWLGITQLTEAQLKAVFQHVARNANCISQDAFKAVFDREEEDGFADIPEGIEEVQEGDGPAMAAEAVPEVIRIPVMKASKLRFEMESVRCSDFERVWTSRGTPCEKPLTVWRMEISKSKMRIGGSYSKKFTFGHVVRPGYSKPSSRDDYPALLIHIHDRAGMRAPGELRAWMAKFAPHPVAYRLVWAMKGEHSSKLYVWKPVPPSEHFVGVGIVCTTEKQEPALDEVRCFPKDWCVKGSPQFMWEETSLGEPVKVWAGNGFGSCHFQTVGHPLDVLEPRPGKWYADVEPAEDVPQQVQEDAFEIMAARLLSHESRDGTTYYVVDVTSTFGESWKVYKRYNMFLDLRSRCKSLGHDTTCSFPSKTLLRVSGEALEERRKALDWYMTELVDKAKQPWGGVLRPFLTEFLQVEQVT
eukprot:TRINITY_DN7171_c0_g2_i1.p1 TRINITY_DN7171_c0_g2~~TRINITY_DN7171_c0_g2_i1.p1  ORF type:complete len:2989 (+),score=1239.68 TRINITY_DN7171_c0_g2_i1:95-8968(+)